MIERKIISRVRSRWSDFFVLPGIYFLDGVCVGVEGYEKTTTQSDISPFVSSINCWHGNGMPREKPGDKK